MILKLNVKRKLALNLSNYQIAKQLEIEQSTISKWLNKNQVPETSSLIKLSSILDCSVEFLLGRDDLTLLDNMYLSWAQLRCAIVKFLQTVG